MAHVVVVIEDIDKDSQQMKQWIESDIHDVAVWRYHDPREAEEKLQQYHHQVSCIVLDMFFPSLIGPSEEAQGQRILDRFPHIPTILVSQKAESRTVLGRKKYVPLLQLDKPANLFPGQQPAYMQEVNDFRRDLMEAIHCCVLVHSLRTELAQTQKKRFWPALVEMRTGRVAIWFAVFVVMYAMSVLFLDEFIQHLILAVCAVTLVHLLDRVFLFKDFNEALQALHKRLDELAMEKENVAEEKKAAGNSERSSPSRPQVHAAFGKEAVEGRDKMKEESAP
jgi:hypothetical protein